MGWSLATGSCPWKCEGKCWKSMLFASSSFIWCVIMWYVCVECVWSSNNWCCWCVFPLCVCLFVFFLKCFSFLFNQRCGKNNMVEREKNHHEMWDLRVNCLFNLSFFQSQNCYCWYELWWRRWRNSQTTCQDQKGEGDTCDPSWNLGQMFLCIHCCIEIYWKMFETRFRLCFLCSKKLIKKSVYNH